MCHRDSVFVWTTLFEFWRFFHSSNSEPISLLILISQNHNKIRKSLNRITQPQPTSEDHNNARSKQIFGAKIQKVQYIRILYPYGTFSVISHLLVQSPSHLTNLQQGLSFFSQCSFSFKASCARGKICSYFQRSEKPQKSSAYLNSNDYEGKQFQSIELQMYLV